MNAWHRLYASLLGTGCSLVAFMYMPTAFFVFAGLLVTASGCWWGARFFIQWVLKT